MATNAGDNMPAATLFEMTAEGPGQVPSADVFAGKTVAIFWRAGSLHAHLPPKTHAKLHRERGCPEGQGR